MTSKSMGKDSVKLPKGLPNMQTGMKGDKEGTVYLKTAVTKYQLSGDTHLC